VGSFDKCKKIIISMESPQVLCIGVRA